jgi:hypothetical protein
VAPAAGVFWIMDYMGGGRKVLDVEDFHVLRVRPRPASPTSVQAGRTAA